MAMTTDTDFAGGKGTSWEKRLVNYKPILLTWSAGALTRSAGVCQVPVTFVLWCIPERSSKTEKETDQEGQKSQEHNTLFAVTAVF